LINRVIDGLELDDQRAQAGETFLAPIGSNCGIDDRMGFFDILFGQVVCADQARSKHSGQ
jgi:hypothetical protein